MRFLCLTIATIISLSISAAFAQQIQANNSTFLDTRIAPLVLPHAQHLGQQKSWYLKNELDDPAAPSFEKKTYQQPEEAKTAESKLDAQLFGITSFIDSDFDVYGHEIRRYMANTLNPSKMNNPLDVLETYKDIRRAKIVVQHWKESKQSELDLLSQEIETAGSVARLRSKITHTKNTFDQFFTDLENWVQANEDVVRFMFENQGEIEVVYPLYYFMNFDDKEEYLTLHIEREKTLSAIKEYLPFSKMIY